MPYAKGLTGKMKAWRAPAGLAALVLLLLLPPPQASGAVKGRCKDCHDMHGSQGGELSGALTEGGCLGCHAMEPAGDVNIVVTGETRTPQVIHHMEGGDLAAGNFYYVSEDFSPHYENGHNVQGISLQEDPPMDIPPGFINGVQIPGGTGPTFWPKEKQLTCAGTWGCHGDRRIEDPFEAVYGAHHEDDSTIDGSTVGKSYRFLFGVTGVEHPDWEYLATQSSHNGYKGDGQHQSMETISYFCGQCHGLFHPNPFLGGTAALGGTVWHRHPSDVSFADVHIGFADSEYEEFVIYSLETPVAFAEPTGEETRVDQQSIIMCLSCHRAHASPFPDIMRWAYTESLATPGGSTSKKGCFSCHRRK
jgi:predicted CXXCH cytochrome family protein